MECWLSHAEADTRTLLLTQKIASFFGDGWTSPASVKAFWVASNRQKKPTLGISMTITAFNGKIVTLSIHNVG